jgi:hypothetical protein
MLGGSEMSLVATPLDPGKGSLLGNWVVKYISNILTKMNNSGSEKENLLVFEL